MNAKAFLNRTSALIAALILLTGCVGRTGKMGTPIAERYKSQLALLKLGVSTPDDLKTAFGREKAPSLKEARIENGKRIEIWEVARGGDMDAAGLLLWGYVAYDKDQSILFHFEDGKLVSYESTVHPDPLPTTSERKDSPHESR
jgi:hypothetical protein